MTLTLSTSEFTTLIAATKLTVYTKPREDAILSGLYLYTIDGSVGEDVGEGNVLVGVGFDGATVGQFAVPCSGTLAKPILVPFQDSGWITQMCNTAKAHASAADKEADHSVELSVSGKTLVIKTLTDGFPAGHDTEGRVGLSDVSQFPSADADKRLKTQGITSGAPLDLNALVRVYGERSLSVMRNAAKTLKTPIRVFPSKINGGPAVMTDGNRWRAVTSVETYDGGTNGLADVEPFDIAPAPAADITSTGAAPTQDAE